MLRRRASLSTAAGSIAVAIAACGPSPVAPVSPGPASEAPTAASAVAPAASERPVDVLVSPPTTSAPAPIASAGPPPPPLDPPCKLTKGASLDDPGELRFDEPRAPEPPARGFLALPTSVALRLSPDVVMRPIRARFACFRGCYFQGLSRKPDLAGRVVVEITIAKDSGKVKSVADRGSLLPDPQVIACILEEMKLVKFPAPEIKEVKVIYPMAFLPE